MKDETIDALLNLGIPAGMKGFAYICDAIELFDTDPYYPDGKICSLYVDIARRRDTTPSRVERAIRSAFETALSRGSREMLTRYLDPVNTQNGNLLRTLYIRLAREKKQHELAAHLSVDAAFRKQFYDSAMSILTAEMESIMAKIFMSAEYGSSTGSP